MQMNANLILAGQTPDVMGAYQSGAMMGEQENEWSRQNALRQLYRDQGAGILSGDPAALNALAGMDPQAAMSAKQAQLQMQSTQQGMAIDQARLTIARQQAAREATQWAQTQDAATVAQQRDKLASGLKGAAYFHQQGDPVGYENYLMQQGIDPTQVPFDQFPAYAATMEGVLEAWNSFAPQQQEWVPATPEQAAQYGAQAGQFNTKTGKFERTPLDTGMSVRTNPDGTVELVQGPGAGGAGVKLTEGQSKDLVYYERATGAAGDLDKFADALTSLQEQGAAAVPLVGNLMTSPEFQQANQAGREWLAAILRKDTGAAITNQEMEIYGKTYLPQPGDSPEVLTQKKAARDRAQSAIRRGLGTAEVVAQEMERERAGATTTIPQGIDQADWDAMTPEEKALFQ